MFMRPLDMYHFSCPVADDVGMATNLTATVAANVLKLRVQRQMRQEDVARAASMSTKAVSLIENPDSRPAGKRVGGSMSLYTLEKIADALRVPAWQLLVEWSSPDRPPELKSAPDADELAMARYWLGLSAEQRERFSDVVRAFGFPAPPLPSKRQGLDEAPPESMRSRASA